MKAEKTKVTRAPETRPRYNSDKHTRPGSPGADGTTIETAVPRYQSNL
jgi:hypothetical protein